MLDEHLYDSVRTSDVAKTKLKAYPLSPNYRFVIALISPY